MLTPCSKAWSLKVPIGGLFDLPPPPGGAGDAARGDLDSGDCPMRPLCDLSCSATPGLGLCRGSGAFSTDKPLPSDRFFTGKPGVVDVSPTSLPSDDRGDRWNGDTLPETRGEFD